MTAEQTLKLSCYAPKDSSVTAYLDENRFELEPENSSSSENEEYIKFSNGFPFDIQLTLKMKNTKPIIIMPEQ